ncbi:MAG: cell division protein FtsZ [Puniceicoccaceae bacterium]
MEQPGFFPEEDPLVSDQLPDGGLRIKIIGVGGAGTNAVDRIKLEDLEQVHLTAIDTDSQVLSASPVEETFLLGRTVTSGKSAGGSVNKGRMAAEADVDALGEIVKGVDLVFLLAGLGGGTGSGAAPFIAEQAAAQGALVIAFTPIPFKREGAARSERADKALADMRKHCHAVITLPNDLIFEQIEEDATLMEAFALADKWIKLGVHSIWSMLFNTGLINVDFSTLQSALSEPGGKTIFGTGYGKGDNLVDQALQDLKGCPLLHLPDSGFIKDTDQLIINLTGGPDMTMATVNKTMDVVGEIFGCRNSIIMGASIDGSFYNQLRITVMGTVRSAASAKGYAPVSAASIPENEPLAKPLKPAESFAAADPVMAAKRQQDEFAFPSPEDNRGLFEKTQRNIYEGEDLDIPTYLRRGMKIPRN